MADQKAVAKTDMAAVITDNKSGVPDRPPAVSQKLKNEQAVYQRDVLGKKDVPLPVATDENVGGKKHEMTNLLQREEARLQKIGQHLDKPELLEQKLREQTTQRGESEFASSANIKTDDNMRMTDDVRGPSPNQNAGPQAQQAPGGGGGVVGPPGGAPMRLPSKEKVAAGKATGTSYATDGNYPKTDMAAGITDNRSKLSKTAQDEVRRQEEIYARDRLQAPVPQGLPVAGLPRETAPTSNQAHISERPGFVTGTTADRMRNEEMAYARDVRAPVKSGRASLQMEGRAFVPQGGRMSMPTAGRTSVQQGGRSSEGGERVMAATIYTKEDGATTTSEEQPPRVGGWLPQSFQRVIDSGMEKIYGQRLRRPYRPPMLEMEVEEDDYDPYFERHEVVQVVCNPEGGRVMYPGEKRRKTRRPVYPAEEDFDVMFQDEVVMGGGRSVMYDDEGDTGYADEGDMYDEETEDVLYMEDMMYPGGQTSRMMYRQAMMQPMMQPIMGQPMMQPMMGSPVMQQMGQPMMQQMGQPMMQQMGQPMMQQMGQPMMQPMGQPMMPQMAPTIMPQMGQPMMQPPIMQAMPAQQYGYSQQTADQNEMYDHSQSVAIDQKDHIEVTSSDSDVNVKWTKQYTVGLPSDADDVNQTTPGVRIDQRVKVTTQKDQSSSTESEESGGKISTAVQTTRQDPISEPSQTDRPAKDSKGIEAKADTDDAATQRNRSPERAADTQTFGTSPFVPGAGMPFMFPPGMMNPYMMGGMGMPQQQVPVPPPPPPLPDPPPPPVIQCEECAQAKSCCDDVPFEELQKNIEDDIANIVNENLDVKISDEDTKILVARPDSPYKLVYLIPQRPQIVKEEKSSQTAKQPTDKSIQTDGKKTVKGALSFDTDGGEGERVIMASYNTQERQINGKRVRTTKAFRVTQSDDEKVSVTEVQESSSSSEDGRSRSKRRSRSKKRAKRARSDGTYPRSLTISVGRTSSTTSRSRSPGHGRRTPSIGAARSETPVHGRRHRRRKGAAPSTSSCSVSSEANVSIVGPASNPEATSCTARAYADKSPARTHSRSPSRKQAVHDDDEARISARRTVVTSDTNISARSMENVPELVGDVKPKMNKVYVERVYNERPESSRLGQRMGKRAPSPPPLADMTTRMSGERPPSPRGGREKGGMMFKPPRSVSSVFQTAAESRCYQSPNRNASYIEAERIAKQIAQQIAPQIIAARQKEPQAQDKQKSGGQSSVLQDMITTARQHHQQLQQQQQQQQQQSQQRYQQQLLQPRRSQLRQPTFPTDEETILQPRRSQTRQQPFRRDEEPPLQPLRSQNRQQPFRRDEDTLVQPRRSQLRDPPFRGDEETPVQPRRSQIRQQPFRREEVLVQPRRSQLREPPFRRDEETTRYENRTFYETDGRYTVTSQQSLERLKNAEGSRIVTENKVCRYGPPGAAPVTSSLSQSFPQRYAGGSYRRAGGGGGVAPPRRSATMSSVSRNLQQSPQHLQSRGSPLCGNKSPQARYILPIQLQVTGRPSRVGTAGGYNQPPRGGGSRLSPGLSRSRSKIMMQQQEQRSSVVMRSIEPDSSSPPRTTPTNSCHGDKKRAFYKRAYRLRIPAQEKQVLTYALVALVALISIILVINTLGKRRATIE